MGLEIVVLVLVSAVMHPVWNLVIKKNPDPQLGYLFLTITMSICALAHGLVSDADFAAALTVLPLAGLSVCGQVLYGTCLTATLKRGDLSAYYPIIRSSPVFVFHTCTLSLAPPTAIHSPSGLKQMEKTISIPLRRCQISAIC